MYPDMVRVTVAALRVVAEQQVGVLVSQQPGQLPRRLLRIGTCKPDAAGRIIEQDRSSPAVGVTQMNGLLRAEDRRALPQGFQSAAPMQTGPYLTVGGHHDDDPVTLGREPGDRAAGEQHLVVRVGVKRDDSCHTREPNRVCQDSAATRERGT
jgi:hypothetical protein